MWTCKTTGKTNLTYEEALISEHRAAEKVQQFPKELVAPVLEMIQYSRNLETTCTCIHLSCSVAFVVLFMSICAFWFMFFVDYVILS